MLSHIDKTDCEIEETLLPLSSAQISSIRQYLWASTSLIQESQVSFPKNALPLRTVECVQNWTLFLWGNWLRFVDKPLRSRAGTMTANQIAQFVSLRHHERWQSKLLCCQVQHPPPSVWIFFHSRDTCLMQMSSGSRGLLPDGSSNTVVQSARRAQSV